MQKYGDHVCCNSPNYIAQAPSLSIKTCSLFIFFSIPLFFAHFVLIILSIYASWHNNISIYNDYSSFFPVYIFSHIAPASNLTISGWVWHYLVTWNACFWGIFLQLSLIFSHMDIHRLLWELTPADIDKRFSTDRSIRNCLAKQTLFTVRQR